MGGFISYNDDDDDNNSDGVNDNNATEGNESSQDERETEDENNLFADTVGFVYDGATIHQVRNTNGEIIRQPLEDHAAIEAVLHLLQEINHHVESFSSNEANASTTPAKEFFNKLIIPEDGEGVDVSQLIETTQHQYGNRWLAQWCNKMRVWFETHQDMIKEFDHAHLCRVILAIYKSYRFCQRHWQLFYLLEHADVVNNMTSASTDLEENSDARWHECVQATEEEFKHVSALYLYAVLIDLLNNRWYKRFSMTEEELQQYQAVTKQILPDMMEMLYEDQFKLHCPEYCRNVVLQCLNIVAYHERMDEFVVIASIVKKLMHTNDCGCTELTNMGFWYLQELMLICTNKNFKLHVHGSSRAADGYFLFHVICKELVRHASCSLCSLHREKLHIDLQSRMFIILAHACSLELLVACESWLHDLKADTGHELGNFGSDDIGVAMRTHLYYVHFDATVQLILQLAPDNISLTLPSYSKYEAYTPMRVYVSTLHAVITHMLYKYNNGKVRFVVKTDLTHQLVLMRMIDCAFKALGCNFLWELHAWDVLDMLCHIIIKCILLIEPIILNQKSYGMLFFAVLKAETDINPEGYSRPLKWIKLVSSHVHDVIESWGVTVFGKSREVLTGRLGESRMGALLLRIADATRDDLERCDLDEITSNTIIVPVFLPYHSPMTIGRKLGLLDDNETTSELYKHFLYCAMYCPRSQNRESVCNMPCCTKLCSVSFSDFLKLERALEMWRTQDMHVLNVSCTLKMLQNKSVNPFDNSVLTLEEFKELQFAPLIKERRHRTRALFRFEDDAFLERWNPVA